MTWSNKRLLTLPPATPKDEADLLAHLLTIAPGFDYAQNANTKGLQQSPELQTYLRRHARSGPYVWQWLKRPPAVKEPASACAAEQDRGTTTSSAQYHPPGSIGQGAMGPSWSVLCVVKQDRCPWADC